MKHVNEINAINLALIDSQNSNFFNIDPYPLIRKLYLSQKEIEETVSLSRLKNELVGVLKQLKEEGRECSANDIQQSITRLLSIEVREFENIYRHPHSRGSYFRAPELSSHTLLEAHR